MNGSPFNCTEPSMMNYIVQAGLSLMEKGGEGLFGGFVFEKAFNVAANCRALLRLFKSLSAQRMITRKNLAREAFFLELENRMVAACRRLSSRKTFEKAKLKEIEEEYLQLFF